MRATLRTRILETAVRLFADLGYAETTSKMICREAGVNIAAVNYYFGSREDLYRAVLDDVHEHIVNLEEMGRIMNCGLSAEEKLCLVLDAYINTAYSGENWYAKIWAHELMTPSPVGGMSFLAGTLPKEAYIRSLTADVTGIAIDDPVLDFCIIQVMAPYLLMLCVHRDMARGLTSFFDYSPMEANRHLKELIMFSLKSYAERYRRGEIRPLASPSV
ncbi:MAG: TetR/AcrR family transcriptional regulator [Mailhella sp.]|nr:TetR/AcrR family transcriptional regulator [Mailhella sp.]